MLPAARAMHDDDGVCARGAAFRIKEGYAAAGASGARCRTGDSVLPSEQGGEAVEIGSYTRVLARLGRDVTLERGTRGFQSLVAKFFIHQGKNSGPNRNDR